jgi:hypothetical protein
MISSEQRTKIQHIWKPNFEVNDWIEEILNDFAVEKVALQGIQFLLIKDCKSIQYTYNRRVQQWIINEIIKTLLNSSLVINKY